MDHLDSVQGMLDDVFPNVDSRLRKDRSGTPFQKLFAVGRGELSEPEIQDMVDRAGVAKEYETLSPEQRPIVDACLAGLWKIDRMGRSIEATDQSVIGSVELMKKFVEQNSEEIGRGYHGGVFVWLDNSVISLLKAAHDTDSEDRRFHKDGVMSPADNYIKKLVSVGADYRSRTGALWEDQGREKLNEYLDHERVTETDQLKGFLFGEVSSAVGALEPSSEAIK